MIGRILAAAVAIGLVILATATESDTGKLSAQRTAAQIARNYGADAQASCHEKSGYWSYVCRVQRAEPTRVLTVHVRVDEDRIVDRSAD